MLVPHSSAGRGTCRRPHQGELAALLVRVTVTEPERFREELAAMSTELNAHLDYEEEVLLPLLADVPWPPAAPRVT